MLLRYLCKLSDQELRQSAARNMADLMWSTVKEPLDSALCFDKESLDLAFKYFMSPTLTMRLAGLSQITVSRHGDAARPSTRLEQRLRSSLDSVTQNLGVRRSWTQRLVCSEMLTLCVCPQNQLHTFNDVCNNESLVSDTET